MNYKYKCNKCNYSTNVYNSLKIHNNIHINNNTFVKKENITNIIPFKNTIVKKENISNNIPLNIYQTWSSKNLPLYMKSCVESLKYNNPEFNHYLYDDTDCYNFIKDNFNEDILYAFDNLIPGAYKADLWRYCILYINGGIYLDIKFECKDGFKLINLLDKEYYVLDKLGWWSNNNIGIYNAMMICKPKNEFLLKCINKIVENVKNKYYGYNCLYPTGPGLMGLIYADNKHLDIDIETLHHIDNAKIVYKNKIIIAEYSNYRKELHTYNKSLHYTILWDKREIYSYK